MFTHHRLSIKSSGKCSLLEDSMGQSYRDLIACQKSMDFVMDVYRATKAFPRDEVYRSEEHTSELQSHSDLVCRLLLEKKKDSRDGMADHCSVSRHHRRILTDVD